MRKNESPRRLLSSLLEPEAPLPEALRWAVAHASLAPSELNSQPWRFRADIDLTSCVATVELSLDESRALPAIDPDRREAVLACGAALLNLRLALHGAELGTTVRLCPDPQRPDLLAEVTVQGRAVEPLEDRALRLAIPLRTTHRASFERVEVPASAVDQLVAEAGHEEAFITVLDEVERAQLIALNAEADQRLWLAPAVRREVATWSRANTSTRPDGVPGFAHGLRTWQSWLEPALLRAGLADVQEEAEEQQAVGDAPVLLIVGAASGSRESLMRAGAGMQRVLLSATNAGLAASYLNAALHVPELARSLGHAVGIDHPQVVLRIGYADQDRPTPRRPESAVLELRETGDG